MLKFKKYVIPVLVCLFLILLAAGCGKKKEAPEQKTEPQAAKQDTVKEMPKVPEVKLPDLVGRWSGQTMSKSTVLKIDTMDGLKFNGSITMNFKNPINNTVSGTIDTAKKSFTMQDIQRGRFAGSYAGKFSQDFKKMSGTFTIKADGQKFNFTLVKK